MNQKRTILIPAGLILAASLFAAALTALLLTDYYNRAHFQELGAICQTILDAESGTETKLAVLSALKRYSNHPVLPKDENILLSFGYKPSYFLHSASLRSYVFAVIGFLSGGALFLLLLLAWRKKEIASVDALTDYLKKVNTKKSGILASSKETKYSKLQDEIYKTVTELWQTREAALKARNHYAENLSNIAHQIKTPITSISLSAQMMRCGPSSRHLEQIRHQLLRLTRLSESLLTLSRIEAGTFTLEKASVGVYTLLMLAVDNLQELFSKAHVSCRIEHSDTTEGESEGLDSISIDADPEWTMEAILNLLKNCMEHTPPGGTVHGSYDQNPLYTRIRIWDTGNGFDKEDLPHLFERFYRGKSGKAGGIGIGLALSKAIIENQNGTISAYNLTDAGACFEIHFYKSAYSTIPEQSPSCHFPLL